MTRMSLFLNLLPSRTKIISSKKSTNNLFNDMIRTAWLSRIYQYV
jgi:hypothetical protein